MKTQSVLVVDMSTLRFRNDSSSRAVRVTLHDGTLLAVVHPRKGEQRPDLAFRAMDTALAKASILLPDPHNPRMRRSVRLALYNPFSGDVAYGETPHTRVFNSGASLDLDRDGTVAEVQGDSTDAQLVVGERVLPAVIRDQASTAAAIRRQARRH